MKKIALPFAIVLILGMAVTAHAAEPRVLNIMPGLSFSGTTAECSVVVSTNAQATLLLEHLCSLLFS